MFHVDLFLKELERLRFRPATISEYRRLLFQFFGYCADHGIGTAGKVTADLIMQYCDISPDNTPVTETAHHMMSRLRRYFRFLHEKGLIFSSPFHSVNLPRCCRHHHPALELSDIRNRISALSEADPFTVRSRAILELAYSSALRPQEIRKVRISEINAQKGLLFVSHSKGGTERWVPVGVAALERIGIYLDEVRPRYCNGKSEDYVFISHRGGAPLSSWGLRRAVVDALTRSGRKPLAPYSVRATAATHLLESGMNLTHISALLGHEDVKSTQVYLHIRRLNLAQQLREKHPRNRMIKSNYTENEYERRVLHQSIRGIPEDAK